MNFELCPHCKLQNVSNSKPQTRWIVHMLCAIFGTSCWIAIYGLWVQTPILVEQLPEKGTLTSYMVLDIQIANVAPIFYGIFRKRLKNYEDIIIHITFCISIISLIIMSFSWKTTVVIKGQLHSVALMLLTLLLGIVDSISSVLFVPYMAHFKPSYLMAFMIGEALSGLIPGIVSFLQGISDSPICVEKIRIVGNVTSTYTDAEYPEPRFSVSYFCLFLSLIMIFSWISFIILSGKIFNSEKVINQKFKPFYYRNSETHLIACKGLSQEMILRLLVMQAFVCLLSNGIIPAIQALSSQPYGQLTHYLAVRFTALAITIACFLAFYFKKIINLRLLYYATFISTTISTYIIFTAISSPNPPLKENSWGIGIILTCWTSASFLFSYIRSCVAYLLRTFSKEGHRSLFWYGFVTQTGSAVGALLTFFLLNYTALFKVYNPCESLYH